MHQRSLLTLAPFRTECRTRLVSHSLIWRRRELKFRHVGQSHMKRYKFKVERSAECVLYFSDEFWFLHVVHICMIYTHVWKYLVPGCQTACLAVIPHQSIEKNSGHDTFVPSHWPRHHQHPQKRNSPSTKTVATTTTITIDSSRLLHLTLRPISFSELSDWLLRL